MTVEKNKTRTIYQQLLKVQKEIKKMDKLGRNEFHKYNYLSESQITELFKELFEKHDIMFMFSSTINGVENGLTNVVIDYEFIDTVTGETAGGTAAGQGMDKGDKGVYKAITGAIKYIFMKTFLIPTGDDPEKEEVNSVKKDVPVENLEDDNNIL